MHGGFEYVALEKTANAPCLLFCTRPPKSTPAKVNPVFSDWPTLCWHAGTINAAKNSIGSVPSRFNLYLRLWVFWHQGPERSTLVLSEDAATYTRFCALIHPSQEYDVHL
jgi:hypothetical protein